MALATLTNKGQATIPKKVRDSPRLHTGVMVNFFLLQKMGTRFYCRSRGRWTRCSAGSVSMAGSLFLLKKWILR